MSPRLVRCRTVSLAAVLLPAFVAGAQRPATTLQFVAGAVTQNTAAISNTSTLGLAAGLALDVPVHASLAIRVDGGVVYFGKSLVSDVIVDCASEPCPQPESRMGALNGGLSIVVHDVVGPRAYAIVGVRGHRALTDVRKGNTDALGADLGLGVDISSSVSIEAIFQRLSHPMGQTRWMLPISLRWRM